MTDWDIPALLPDKLATVAPTTVYAGGRVSDPLHCLFVWRTYSLTQARGMTVGFYVWDDKLEGLWRNPERQTARFLAAGVAALIEPDFSLWADAPLVEQLWAIYRMRTLGRLYQEHGLNIIPNLAWSDERSFSFAFTGVPQHAPLVSAECRTAGQTDEDRRAFLAGLTEGIRQVRPAHVVVYGGQEHGYWLCSRLPAGPRYTLLESWTRARGRVRRQEARHQRHSNQFLLFSVTGGDGWVDEDHAAAPAVAAHA